MPKGLFAALFDLHFTSLLTTKIVKLLYVLSMVVIALFRIMENTQQIAARSGESAPV